MRRLRSVRIATRLILWFLLIALVPLCVVIYSTFQLSKETLVIETRNNLFAVAQRQSDQIEAFLREKQHSVTAISTTQAVYSAIERCSIAFEIFPDVHSEEYQEQVQGTASKLIRIQEAFHWKNLALVSREGFVVYQTHPDQALGTNLGTGPLRESTLGKLYDRSTRLLGTEVSDFDHYGPGDSPALFVASPILRSKRFMGLLIVELEEEELYDLINDYTGLGMTGETVVGSKRGKDQAVFVAPSRNDPDAAFQRTVGINTDHDIPLALAVQGQKGFNDEVADYRGEQVLAVWKYVPIADWGMVVKVDASEAFQPIERLRNLLVLLAAVTCVGVVIAALSVSRTISRPIEDLILVADKIAAGDLTPKIEVTSNDEVGVLRKSVRTMTQNLNSLVGKIRESINQLNVTAAEINATSRQQESSVNELGTSTNEIVATAKEISATSRELVQTMDDVSQAAAGAADLATSSQDELSGMGETMRSLLDATLAISEKLRRLQAQAREIDEVVMTITRVADQTNLLSLNAAIEAEKAGKHGIGFSVVATEIRRLADQTAVATLDIDKMIKQTQAAVMEGVNEMDAFAEVVRTGTAEVTGIGGKLGRIISEVQALTPRFSEVNQSMQAQSQGAGQISAAIVQINETAQRTAASLHEFQTVTAHLNHAASSLKDEVSRFKLSTEVDESPPVDDIS